MTTLIPAVSEADVKEFRRLFEDLISNSQPVANWYGYPPGYSLRDDEDEPECKCDIKALFGTTGHDKHCAYVAWKARKAKQNEARNEGSI